MCVIVEITDSPVAWRDLPARLDRRQQRAVAGVVSIAVLHVLGLGALLLVVLLAEQHGIIDGPPTWVGGLDLAAVGFVIVGLFAFTWAVAVTVWRFGGLEQRRRLDRMGAGPG